MELVGDRVVLEQTFSPSHAVFACQYYFIDASPSFARQPEKVTTDPLDAEFPIEIV
jgi:hypothetical protein